MFDIGRGGESYTLCVFDIDSRRGAEQIQSLILSPFME
jgi:hypothetical protein